MNLKKRRKLIDEINDAFIDFIVEYRGKRYADVMRAINREMIDNVEVLSPEMVRTIIERETAEFNPEDVAVFGLLLGAITAILENQRMTAKQRESIAPILAFMGLYSLANPKRFVKKLHISLTAPSSVKEKEAHALLTKYKTENARIIAKVVKQQKHDLLRAQLKAKLPQSKRMIAEMQTMTGEGKPLEMQRHWMRRKYNNTRIINRAIDTEVHAGLARSSLISAQEDGFTHKIWKTQEDDRVRRTTWHNQVANQKIPIDDDFRVGNMRASAPGDIRLPAGERINCRCYLIYQ